MNTKQRLYCLIKKITSKLINHIYLCFGSGKIAWSEDVFSTQHIYVTATIHYIHI